MHGFIEELQQYHHDKAGHLHDLQNYSVRLADDRQESSKEELTELFEPFRSKLESAHHRNEELILLHLRTTDAPIHPKVKDISADHAAFDRIIERITAMIFDAAVTRAELSATIQSFVTIYNDHAGGEENIFFPIADQYLTAREWRAVGNDWITASVARRIAS